MRDLSISAGECHIVKGITKATTYEERDGKLKKNNNEIIQIILISLIFILSPFYYS